MINADKSKLLDQFLEWILRDAIDSYSPDAKHGFDTPIAHARRKRVHDLFVRTLNGEACSRTEWSDEMEKSRRVENISYFACVCKLEGYHMGLKLCSDVAAYRKIGEAPNSLRIQLAKLFDLICNEPTLPPPTSTVV